MADGISFCFAHLILLCAWFGPYLQIEKKEQMEFFAKCWVRELLGLLYSDKQFFLDDEILELLIFSMYIL